MNASTAVPSIDATLLLASGAAYDIDFSTGHYDPSGDKTYAPNVGFVGDVQPFSGASVTDGPLINAALVGRTADAIIVAFRGTIPSDTTLAGIEDWLQDFFADPMSGANLPGEVHSGFYTGLMSIYASIESAVQALVTDDALPVYVTGHSKGGGMAPLAAYLLNEAGITVSKVVTFAGPKCGNAAFQSAYQSVFAANHVRYENYGDLVPLCPPSDEFIDLVAAAFKYISTDIYDLIMEASGWDYVSLGSEQYIESPSKHYAINPNENAYSQVADFVFNLGWNWDDPGTALGEAHTISVGFGYMTAVCPAISSPAANVKAAPPSRIAPPPTSGTHAGGAPLQP